MAIVDSGGLEVLINILETDNARCIVSQTVVTDLKSLYHLFLLQKKFEAFPSSDIHNYLLKPATLNLVRKQLTNFFLKKENSVMGAIHTTAFE